MNGTIKRKCFRGLSTAELEEQTSLILQHMTIDELYKEVLYEILHNVGCDVNVEIGQLPLLTYIQDVFKIDSARHQEYLADAEAKEAPEILLDVEVIEAKDLLPKDPNGLSDPFVTIYLTSNKSQRFNTPVQSATLNPTWNRHFSIPLSKDTPDDTLCLEVWDFDPAETVKEKVSKVREVKGMKGFYKFMKEITVTATTGKHDDELIGKAHIPLKTIPTAGMLMWYSLDKKNKTKRGVIKVHLKFSSVKNAQVAIQEHRHLLRILLMHELENSKVAQYWWAGNFCAQAEAIINQHAAQSGLNTLNIYTSQWIVYSTIHSEYPLSFSLFNNLLNKLYKPLESGQISEDESKLFWDGVRKILPSCFSIVRKIRKKTTGDKNVLKLLKDILTLLFQLNQLKVSPSVSLFSPNQYGWMKMSEDQTYTIKEILVQAITQGANEWFADIVENNDSKNKSDEARLQFLIRIIQMIRSDLQRAVEYYDKHFSENIGICYSKILYLIYEEKFAVMAEPIVLDVCKNLKKMRYQEEPNQVILADQNGEGTRLGKPAVKEKPLTMGTTLFDLYLVLQRFLALGQGLCPVDWSELKIAKFHIWFYGGVTQWLDIAVFKAQTRIEKAVELDDLTPITPDVKISSSAIDTLGIFNEVKIFWQQLDWPDPEGSYTLFAKVLDDICRCCDFYADKMAIRVDGMGNISTVYEKKFEVTSEWCFAVNNIDYVNQKLRSFVKDMGIEDITKKLSDSIGAKEAERCKETLHNVMENAMDTIKNKIIELLEIIVRKMLPSISRFLLEGAELLHQDCSSMDRVMMYLENNLTILHDNLSLDNFTRTLDVIWYQLSDLLLELVQSNLEKRRPPSFFANLHECLKIMIQSFKQNNTESQYNETLQKVEYLLKLHGFETADLIHQHFVERWEQQKAMIDSPFGAISVRALFTNSSIKIEVINARDLLPMDANGSVDSFVRINLLPENLFAGTVRPKTQTHNKNRFPLYDETFTIVLTPDQRNYKNGLVVFNVKDKDMFGMSNQYLAEAFLHFSEIPDTTDDMTTLPQIKLTLTRPTKLEGETIKSLEHRQGDKQAKEFLKKQKQKIGLPH